MKRDTSSNVTSLEVAWKYTAFGNSKVFHPQIMESLDSSDDNSDWTDVFESYMSSGTSQAQPLDEDCSQDNTSNNSVGSQMPHTLDESPTCEDIYLRAGIKANYRRYLKSKPIANESPPVIKGTANVDGADSPHPDTVWTIGDRKSSQLPDDTDDKSDDKTLTHDDDSEGGTVKTASTKKKSPLRKPSSRVCQPIVQDPFSYIQVFNKVSSDEEGTCSSSEDDKDLSEGMGDEAYWVSYLSWSRNKTLPAGWYADNTDYQDDHDPSLYAQMLQEIEDMLGMEWDVKGVYIPLHDAKRNWTCTLKAKYEEMLHKDMGAGFAFLPIVSWGKAVFESNKQAIKKLREKTNKCITGKIWMPLTIDELLSCCISLEYWCIWSMSSMQTGATYTIGKYNHILPSSATCRFAVSSK
jgi:hypothetical protein